MNTPIKEPVNIETGNNVFELKRYKVELISFEYIITRLFMNNCCDDNKYFSNVSLLLL